jgi:kynureninase
VLGGGYKYLQLGEGNCFLRLPAHAEELRPAITGWYAEFGALADEHDPSRVAYGRGAERFAGATYDPTSHYRAARVFAFFDEQGLTPERLRSSYRHQVDLLAAGFDALGVDDAIVTRDRALDLDRVGGFLALRSPHAGALQRALGERGVLTDSRGSWLRLGPAPYLSDEQLEAAIALLGEAVTELR